MACEGKLRNDTLLIQLPQEPDSHWIARLESRFPGFKVKWQHLPWKPGEKLDPTSLALPPETWKDVTMACLFLPHPAHIMSNVRYVQLTSAGVDKWIDHAIYKNPKVTFCTANGTHPPQIAEWVIGTWLMMRNSYLEFADYQRQAKWTKTFPNTEDSPGMRMGILGYGAIGRQCARLANAMGMEVYAFTRSEKSTLEQRRDSSYCVPGLGDPEGLIPTRWFHGSTKSEIHKFLDQDLDILVLSSPLTEATEKIIDREAFRILAKKKTFLSNIARGQLVDTDALVEALQQGQIRGAAADVTDPEPLPDGHPLFTVPNVFITPHISWWTPKYFDRILDILEANLGRLNDEEALLNVVNRVLHY